MRKPFRTTLDEEVLLSLKTKAVENNCNVNDLIEDLFFASLRTEYLSKHDKKFDEMDSLSKECFLERKLTQAIDEVLTTFKLDYGYKPRDTIRVMSSTIAKLAVSLYVEEKK